MRYTVAGLAAVAAFALVGCEEVAGAGDDVNRLDLCAHPPGVVWTADSVSTSCIPYPHVRPGSTVNLVIEAVNRAGPARSASIAVSSGLPQGWTASLGGNTINVPGQQSLTIGVSASSAINSDYPINITASGQDEYKQLQIKIRVIP
jgi:uncharacterized membrane protein